MVNVILGDDAYDGLDGSEEKLMTFSMFIHG